MRILIVLISWLIIAFGSIGIGQISFHKFFSNNGYDYGHGVLQMEDSSYLVCGSSSSFTDGPSQAFLLHVDSLGNYLWSKHYGGEESDVARRVIYVPGYGYFLAGHTNSYGALAYDAYLVHTDLNGNENWHKTYGGNGWERIYDAALTKDSGVLMVGQEDALMSLDKYTDSIYYVAGYSFVGDSSQTKGIIIKLSENGDIYWMDTLGANGNYGIHGIDAVEADNKINFVGWQQTQGTLTKSSYFGRMFLSGQFDFDYAEPNASGEKIYDHITQYGNNGKNYVGFRYYDNSSFQDGYDIAISRLLNGLWWDGYLQSVNYPLEDGCEELIPTSDGGAMAVGFASGNGIGGANVFLLKIGPNELFKITGSTHGEMHLKIFNSLGQMVDEKTIFSGEEVDADNWKDGWYFIEVMEKVGNTDQFDHFKWYKAHQE